MGFFVFTSALLALLKSGNSKVRNLSGDFADFGGDIFIFGPIFHFGWRISLQSFVNGSVLKGTIKQARFRIWQIDFRFFLLVPAV